MAVMPSVAEGKVAFDWLLHCCLDVLLLSKLSWGFLKANICICQVVINISSDGGEEEVAFDWLFGCITIVNQTALSCPSQLSDGPAWSSRRLKPHSCSMIGRNCLGFVTDKPVNSARYSCSLFCRNFLVLILKIYPDTWFLTLWGNISQVRCNEK